MKKICIGLSASEFEKAAREVEKYKKEVVKKTRLLAQRLAEKGVEIAKIKIMQFPAVDTGELLESMQAQAGDVIENGGEWIVFTDCPHAAFVEFGTGVTGSRNPHPDTSLVGWRYDVNEHGDAGWFYFKDGEWHWTKGMISRPFMYETGRDLKKLVSKTAKEVFGE